jgi:hypothetical protein
VNTSKPPRMAHWLLEQWANSPTRESLIGDLLEQYQRGRPAAWFWRQTVRAVIASLAADVRQHKGLAISVVALSTYLLPQIYMFVLWPKFFYGLDGVWYPHLIGSRWSWMVMNPWAYRLELYSLTSRLCWCPRQRGLVVTLFLATQVGACLPHLRIALVDWLGQPGNPMWFFHLAWFSIFTFVAIPFSILRGGLWTAREA